MGQFDDKKGSNFNLIFRRHLKLLISIFLVLFIGLIIVLVNVTKDKDVIKVGEVIFTENDFNMYVYSNKYQLYGEQTDLPEATLNSEYSDGLTVAEYLKNKSVEDIVLAGSVTAIANKNNISLTEEDKDTLETEKQKYIDSLGGKQAFKKILSSNHTTEQAYDKMAEVDRLYSLLIENLYAEGKINDLTAEEKSEAEQDYENNYYKIKQIVLAKVDLTTGEQLSDKLLAEQKELANELLTKIENGENFDVLVEEYTQDDYGKEDNYEIYFTDGDLLEEIGTATTNLSVGDISNVIETDNGFHIIRREELDDAGLNKAYSKKRENKLLQDIIDLKENVSIIYYDTFEKIKIS